jgi:hypothetical protein
MVQVLLLLKVAIATDQIFFKNLGGIKNDYSRRF